MIGIFWLIPVMGEVRLLAHTLALDKAETYGDCLTCPLSHIDAWEGTKRGVKLLSPLDSQSRAVIATSEYEEWPRGRVVFEIVAQHHIAYADPQAFAYAEKIREMFQLPENTLFKTDLHW